MSFKSDKNQLLLFIIYMSIFFLVICLLEIKMSNSPESNFVEPSVSENNCDVSLHKKIVDVHPLAFTIEFNDQKVDEVKKSKVHERLSAFSFKHKRNPSLPDFGAVKNAKNSPPMENVPSPLNSQHVPIISKGGQKSGRSTENQWKSSALKAIKNCDLKSPIVLRSLEVNGVKENFLKHFKNGRRNSLNDIDNCKKACQNNMPIDIDYKIVKNGATDRQTDYESKSDTVSEAGTYTVDKEDEVTENDLDRTQVIDDHQDEEQSSIIDSKKSFRSSWINDWVRDVEEQNMRNPKLKEAPQISRNSSSGHSSPGASKIPSPINTLSRKVKSRSVKSGEEKILPVKVNGSVLYKRSSLNAKDYNENHGSESSLETESFLRATESVVTAMQNRMRLALDDRATGFKNLNKKDFNYKERPHPPSTASDTDTNSETDVKGFKKAIGNPFSSARLNRAFSLRRAKAGSENEFGKKKISSNLKETDTKHSTNPRSSSSPKTISTKPPCTPFSRTDCGRFSMRSTVSSIRTTTSSQGFRKEVKKSSTNNRSASSLSSREVEFQNWRRRKSFDPMKAAAEGRKKELAKKAAMNQTMTQSSNLGSGTHNRSNSGSSGNPVLRSASFHSTAQAFGSVNDDDHEDFQDPGSTDDQEESGASWVSNHHSLLHNSPTQVCGRCTLVPRAPICTSRCSLVSETHSSPSRRLRSDDLDSLVMTAISDLSCKLKIKSCNLLKKLNYIFDTDEEKSFRLRDEIAVLESRRNSSKNSPIHQAASRDLSTILKNLKGLENALKVLDDVLFDENLEIYVNETKVLP